MNHIPIKKIIKRGAQHIAARLGTHTRTSGQPRLLILMYHRILPENDPRSLIEEPGMVVTPKTFALHLKVLQQYFTIVSLGQWLHSRQADQELPANACAITFDDGWADNYDYAFPLLQQYNLPATIFLVANMVGTSRDFWPGRVQKLISTISRKYPQHHMAPQLQWLQHRFSRTPPSQDQLSHIIADLKKHTDEQIHQYIDHTETTLDIEHDSENAVLLTWEQVMEMQGSGLIEFGSHTSNHTRLVQGVNSNTMHTEIIDSKHTIERHTGKTVSTFCYPNGDLCTAAVDLVSQTYDGAVTTRSGWNQIDTDPFQLQRMGIHEDIAHDRTAFLARISGWI